jgi:hypothetical protein
LRTAEAGVHEHSTMHPTLDPNTHSPPLPEERAAIFVAGVGCEGYSGVVVCGRRVKGVAAARGVEKVAKGESERGFGVGKKAV